MDLIAPAKILWRPVSTSRTLGGENKNDKATGNTRQTSKGKEKVTANTDEDRQRTVWIWVHPSVYDEVICELRISISLTLEIVKLGNPSGSPVEVDLSDLRQELNVFEIMGPKASQVIRGALKPVEQDHRGDFKKVNKAAFVYKFTLTSRVLVLVFSCRFAVSGLSP
jgi:ribonuclease P/MRP protein subunit POP1